jgi:hypothetical protein
MDAQTRLEGVRFREHCDAIIGPDPPGGEQPQQRDLREPAEQELLPACP